MNRYLPLYVPDSLPCHPCPHDAPCCTYGTTLTPTEARGLEDTYGPGTVTHLTPQELQARGWFGENDPDLPARGLWATTVDPHTQRCALYRNHGCAAYHHPAYPVTCRIFPWEDLYVPSLPQAGDAPLCPEIKRTR